MLIKKVSKKSQFEVWAQFRVSKKSIQAIHEFFQDEYNISPQFLCNNLHVTVYHCRRPMPNLREQDQSCVLSIDTLDTRFMVLAPGGENPRKDLIPGKKKVGIRIKKSSPFKSVIAKYRKQFFIHENDKVLGTRKPSTYRTNAFGAKNFQPHISLLEAGSNIISDLTVVGEHFRELIPEIHFDRFIIRKRRHF